MSFYTHNADKQSGDGLAITEWNDLSSAAAGNSGLTLALNSADKIGIGASNPAEKLDVRGNIMIYSGGRRALTIKTNDNSNNQGIAFQNSGDSYTWSLERKPVGPSDADFAISGGKDPSLSNLNEYLRIKKDGNIGIGTSSPSEKLHVNGNVQANGNIQANQFIGDGSQLTNLPVSSTWNQNGSTISYTSGKVGIGTTSPATKLHIMGGNDVGANVSNSGYLIIGNAGGLHIAIDDNEIMAKSNGTSAGKLTLQHEGGATSIGGDVGIGLGTNDPSEKLHVAGNIKSTGNLYIDGNVGIGTTSPKQLLHVNGDYYGRGHVFLYAHEGDGSSGTAYLQARDTSNSSIALQLRTQQSGTVKDVIRLTSDGKVGIGTTSPNKAKLQISGYVSYSFNHYLYTMNNDGKDDGQYNESRYLSIYADQSIAGKFFCAHSDARIKNIQGRSDSAKDLELLKQIGITDYKYKDPAKDGPGRHKKVIGQQVAEVFPQAVTINTEVVPDIMQKASLKDGFIALEGVVLAKGEKIRLIFPDESSELAEVLESGTEGIKVNSKETGEVFVYGREVNDFHIVDYDALSMLHLSATQELIRIIEQQQQRIATLESKL